jgi:hypothetical protein
MGDLSAECGMATKKPNGAIGEFLFILGGFFLCHLAGLFSD